MKKSFAFVRSVLVGGCALVSLFHLSARASSAATVWTGGGSTTTWFDGSNWNNGLPDSTQDITINGAGFNPIIDTSNAASKNFTLTTGSLTVNSGRTWTATTDNTSTLGTTFIMNINGGTATGASGTAVNVQGTVNVNQGGSWNMGYYANLNGGKINLGNATTPGTFNPQRNTRADANSTFRGWGTIRHGGWSDNYFFGTTVADGWGGNADRELKFQLNGISDSYSWRMTGSATSTAGYYAVNRGYITMPVLPYSSAITSRGWASQDSSGVIDPTAVNGFRLSFTNVTHAGTKNILGQLLAIDVSAVPHIDLADDGFVSAIYKLTPDAGFTFTGTTTFTHRYDQIMAGLSEADLTVYHYNELLGIWEDLSQIAGYSLTHDLVNNRLTLTGFNNATALTGYFAVGVGIVNLVPEPSGIVLLALGSLMVVRRRRLLK